MPPEPSVSMNDEQFERLAVLAAALELDYPHNALTSALAGRVAGIPNRLCYAPSPDRLTVCGREHGHGNAHNTRHDLTGQSWA